MAKNIVICCDGTGNDYGKNNTNVVKLYQLAQKTDEQVVCYDPGVGTGRWRHWQTAKRLFNKCTGGGLQRNVEDAYRFLMQNHADGDRVFLFGFSRGAFTVRSLAGMLHKCGLLRAELPNMVPCASQMYNTAGNNAIASDFKSVFSRLCPVHFIGVWDTVGSLALAAGRKFHDAALNPEVSHGYHAVALDEVRQKFPPSLWVARDGVEQVWFAGVHSDVGGWYSQTGLSNIALKWMAQKALAHGMLLDEGQLAKISGDPLAPQHDSYTGLWKAMGKYVRALPQGALVHASVRERLGNVAQTCNDNGKVKKTAPYTPQATTYDKNPLQTDSDIQWVA